MLVTKLPVRAKVVTCIPLVARTHAQLGFRREWQHRSCIGNNNIEGRINKDELSIVEGCCRVECQLIADGPDEIAFNPHNLGIAAIINDRQDRDIL